MVETLKEREYSQQKDALINGSSPIFPNSLRELNRLYFSFVKNGALTLDEVVKTVEWFTAKIPKFETSDGYEWERAYEFRRNGGSFIIAFPKTRDSRSIAIYLVDGKEEQFSAHILGAHFSLSLGAFLGRPSYEKGKS